jgi:carboxypeptidase Taq
MTPYQSLEATFRRAALIGEAAGIVGWDTSVMMPEGAAAMRADQSAMLGVLAHETLTRPEIPDWLAAAEAAGDGLDAWQRANLREMRRIWTHASAVPADLVEALSKACSACETVWREAKPKADFKLVRPKLAEVLRLTREDAAAKAARLGLSPYDALLDQYEPGGRAAEIDPIFERLARELPPMIGAVIERQKRTPPKKPRGRWPVAAQKALSKRLMETIGFDFARGRLDESRHPFSGGGPDDRRITTRYDEADFATALMATLHETGHAMYEAQLPAAWRRQPVGRARGMVLHESQSLLMEMQACRGRAFLGYAAPIVRRALGGKGPAWTADNLYRLGIAVKRGFIRVDADEMTYPCHVILRYRLERALLAGDLALADLPGAWNDLHRDLIGVAPPNDRLGCLQDIHWYDGAIGYFPTYTLGAMAAAQLFEAAGQALPRLQRQLGKGDFKPLLAWLEANVHGKGSLLATREVMAAATGRPLDEGAFLAHLERRYLA